MLQVVLPCLLAVNQATTDTNVVSREGQGPPGPQSCSPREYWIAGRCCKACPAGQHVGEHCQRSHSWGQCVPCPPGTFMNCLNGMEACFKCSACSKNEEVLEECTPTDDLVCQCRPGYFYVGSSESCSPCSTCPAGHVVIQSCNTTADTVCGLPAPGHPGSSWACLGVSAEVCIPIIVAIVVIIVIIVIAAFVVYRRRTGSRNRLSGSSPGTSQSNDLEMGPLVAGEDTSQESMGNSALLAPESPGVAELLQVANRSLAAPGEPGDQARMLEAPRPPGEAEPSPSVDGKKQVRGPSG